MWPSFFFFLTFSWNLYWFLSCFKLSSWEFLCYLCFQIHVLLYALPSCFAKVNLLGTSKQALRGIFLDSYISEIDIILSSHLKNNSIEWKILYWKLFFLRILKILLHFFLALRDTVYFLAPITLRFLSVILECPLSLYS